MSQGVDRRALLTAGALLGAAPVLPASAEVIRGRGMPWQANTAASPVAAAGGDNFVFFTQAEAAFIEAAVQRLIPKDELGPGALEAGVPIFIDRQLAGEYGAGGRWYMQGPWAKGEKTQGYQSRLTPAQMYRAAIKAVDEETNRTAKAAFAGLAPADQDALLKTLEAGEMQLSGGADAKTFFKLLLQNVTEGFFSDPIYGGNRDMAGWKLIGYPGARYDKRAYVKAYGQPYRLPPVSIAGRPGWSDKA
jgi:gluconate 2-dehydrogenase gamma chain